MLSAADARTIADPLSELKRARDLSEASPLGALLSARGMGPYRGYSELLTAMLHLVGKGYRPQLMGRSVQGEPLIALHLGAPPEGALTRTSVVLAGVHPNEWIGVESALALAEQLLEVDLGERSAIVVPLLNPDGLRRVERNLRHGARRFVRHNARGVDLNRNFNAGWGKTGLVQRMLRGIFSPGPRPESEPEVAALAHHLAACRIDRAVSLHSFGGAVLYPSAYTTKPVFDHDEHERWALNIAKAISPERPYAARGCARWAKGITAGGLELDWFHERHAALSLLIECSRGGLSLSPASWLEPFAWFNPKALSAEASAIATAIRPFASGAPLC